MPTSILRNTVIHLLHVIILSPEVFNTDFLINALWIKMKCNYAKYTSIDVKRECVLKCTPGATTASHFILLMRTDL
jgi:hypothetical protein